MFPLKWKFQRLACLPNRQINNIEHVVVPTLNIGFESTTVSKLLFHLDKELSVTARLKCHF